MRKADLDKKYFVLFLEDLKERKIAFETLNQAMKIKIFNRF
jgi:hypothetical protein